MTFRTATLCFLFFALAACSPAVFAQQTDCFAQAETQEDMIRCDEKIIYPLEAKFDSEIVRLDEKYHGTQMLQLLYLSRNEWNGYRNAQCMFEAGIVLQTEARDNPKNIAAESDRVFARCVVRTLNEMIAALEKL